MSLPTEQALKSLQPVEHPPITDAELDVGGAQAITLQLAIGMKCLEDGSCEPCTESDPPVVCGRQRYLVNGRQFSESEVLKLKLNTAAEWTLKGLGTEDIPGVEKSERHPFHIHVNPFYYLRSEPDGQRNWVWKDTLLIPVPGSEGPEKVRMRYTRFMGKFVLHCHILIHEDQGMMKLVEIIENSD